MPYSGTSSHIRGGESAQNSENQNRWKFCLKIILAFISFFTDIEANAMSVRVFIQGFAIGSAVAGGSVFLYFSTHEKNVETSKTDLKYFENFKSGPEAIKYKNHFENFKFGLPSRGPDVIKYKNHLLCYDQSRKTPVWVAEHITKANIEGEANRKGSKFQTDSKIPTLFSATNEDFLRSGWSRGHMAPAGNNKHDQV